MDNMKGLGSALPNRKKGGKRDEEGEEDAEYVPSAAERQLIADALTSGNPALLKALEAKLNSMQGASSGFLEALPSKVRGCSPPPQAPPGSPPFVLCTCHPLRPRPHAVAAVAPPRPAVSACCPCMLAKPVARPTPGRAFPPRWCRLQHCFPPPAVA